MVIVVDQEMRLAARGSRLISVNPRSRHENFRVISLKNSKKKPHSAFGATGAPFAAVFPPTDSRVR